MLKRLKRLEAQLAASPAAASSSSELLSKFLTEGFVTISPAELGLDDSIHQRLHKEGCSFLQELEETEQLSIDSNLDSRIPELKEVWQAPAVDKALHSILGEGYAMHPHTFMHLNGPEDQEHHKDGFLPWNGHGLRFHRPEYVLLFYYP